MTDRITTLLEKAMGSDSDAEKLACLKQAARLHRGDSVLLPRRVKKQDDLIIPAGMMPVADHENAVKSLTEQNERLFKENQNLIVENDKLRREKLTMAYEHDVALQAFVKKARRGITFASFGILLGFTAILVGVVVMML